MTGIDNEKGLCALDNEAPRPVPKADSVPNTEELGMLLFEMTSQGVVCQDATGVVSANPAAQRMLGLNWEQMQGRATGNPAWNVVHEDGSALPAELQPGVFALRTGQEIKDVVVGVVNPRDSRRRWLSVTAKPVFRPGERTPFRSLVLLDDITERKLAEDTLRRSEAGLRRAQTAAHMGSWTWHTKTNHLEWSDEMYRVFGIDRADFSGDLADIIARAIHPDDRQKVDESNLAVSRDGIAAPLEYRVIWPDNSVHVIWAEAGEAVLDECGEVTILSGYAQDITERKRSEEALRANEEELRSLFAVLPVGVSILDEHKAIKSFNPALGTMLGLTSDGLRDGAYRQRKYMRLDGTPMPPEEFPSVRAQREQRAVWGVPIGVIKEDGSTVWTEVSAAPLALPNASCVTVTTDITERRLVEARLREQEATYRMLFQSINDALLVSELDDNGNLGKFVLVNDVACERLGYSREELLSKTPADINSESSKQSIGSKIRKVLEEERAIVEAEHVARDGRTVPVEVSTSLATLGRKTVLCSIARDITERKRAAEEKLSLERQLQQAQKMEAVGRLAGGIAHDFNNMLSAILGHVEVAMEEVDSSQELYSDLDEIQKAARRSADLTRQLLGFAREQTVAPRVLNLNRTVEGMLKMLRRLIGEDVDLTWRPDPDLWSVKLDPSQLDQILANLCVNARDAIPQGGKITIGTGNFTFDQAYCAEHSGPVAGDYVQLVVSDNGCGMDKATLARLFEPFFTTKQLGRGTGLGLATVYGIVKQNDGFVDVDSEPGEGTTIRIYLPRQLADVHLAVRSAVLPAAHGSETILVVEDEPSILNMTRRILERQGYSVMTANSPSCAIILAKEYPREIHLLLTDVVMPEMNGRDLAKELLSLLPRLKCLFMSGYTADVIAHYGVLEEGINFIQKPFSKEELSAKVREALDQRSETGIAQP